MELKGKNIALFIADLYEDLEFWYPLIRMQEAGASVTSIGPEAGSYRGKHGLQGSADKGIKDVSQEDFDGLIIPGGYSPDRMRRSAEMVSFVRDMNSREAMIAAICHGPWMLASAEIVQGRELTSFFSIRDDMVHAGAEWVDREVVTDGNIITSRTPDDLPAFCRAIIEMLG
jgi:protease I